MCLLLAACPGTDSRRFHQDPADPSVLAQTWLNAWVYVESQGAVVSSTVGDLRESGVLGSSELAAPALVLVYLHGCDGLWPLRHEEFWTRLATSGFLVVMPDSFVRPQRREECGRQPAWVYQARAAELDYALGWLMRPASEAARDVFVFGHSEGAIALVRQTGRGLAGAVVTGTGCLRFSLTVPTLAVMSRQDPDLHGATCQQASRRILLDGQRHDVLGDRAVQDAIFEFLHSMPPPDWTAPRGASWTKMIGS